MTSARSLLVALGLGAAAFGCAAPVETVSLISENNSGETGTARIYDRGNDSEVDIETQDGMDKNPELAHIRTGQCDESGLVTGYVLENLNTVVNDVSNTYLQNRKA